MAEFKDRLESALAMRDMTPAELSRRTGIGEGAISQYRKGGYKASQRNLEKISKALRVSITYLMGVSEDYNVFVNPSIPQGFEPLPETEKAPLVGSIACGEPITAEENIEDYVDVPKGKNIDFCLTCKGESMIEAGIYDGDIVYIHQQAEVENGEIAAVRIGNEATLKRFYYDGVGKVTLLPANSKYAPLTYSGEEINEIHIEGKAVGFAHWF